MSITTAMTSVPKPAPDLIEAFRGAPTSVISDNLARLPGAVGLRPFHRGSKLVGISLHRAHAAGRQSCDPSRRSNWSGPAT